MMVEQDIAGHVLALEKEALARWGQGDPEGYLAITAEDISYFDPFLSERLDGIESLRKWYNAFRTLRLTFDEIVEPRAQQVSDDAVILTMQFVSHSSYGAVRWNCTEVYQKRGDSWLIVHTHWSPTKPPVKIPGRERR